jgi:hypothetical protein
LLARLQNDLALLRLSVGGRSGQKCGEHAYPEADTPPRAPPEWGKEEPLAPGNRMQAN